MMMLGECCGASMRSPGPTTCDGRGDGKDKEKPGGAKIHDITIFIFDELVNLSFLFMGISIHSLLSTMYC